MGTNSASQGHDQPEQLYNLLSDDEQQSTHLKTAKHAIKSSVNSVSSSQSPDHPSNDDSSQGRWQRWLQRADNLWIYELTGALLSVACFVALVAVLKQADGNEQSKWIFNYLTLNGFIALITTVMRASMTIGVAAGLSQLKWNHFSGRGMRGRRFEQLNAFDQASRGPFGSLKLILTCDELYAPYPPHISANS